MFSKKTLILCVFALGLSLIISGPFGATASAAPGDKPSWTWTKENPKPVWWSWGKDYEKGARARGGYLQYAASRYIGLMNPNHWPVNDWGAMTTMYDFLFYNDGNYRPTVMYLADYYKYENPTTVILQLKKGVRFHDGAEMNAEGLKYQIDWIKNKANGAWSRAWVAPISSVDVVDEYKVRFHFKKQWAGFVGIMATVPGFMISPKALKNEVLLVQAKSIKGKAKKARKKANKLAKKAAKAKGTDGEAKAAKKAKKALAKAEKLEAQNVDLQAKIKDIISLDNRGVGSGKYIYEKASPGNYFQVKRNPDWWFGQSIGIPDLPYPDGVRYTVIPDPSVQLANLRSGKLHVMGITKAQYATVKDDPKIKLHFQTWPHVTALRFNTVKGPCSDLRVRKAISHAIDRKALVEGIQFGLANVAKGMYPERHWAANPETKTVSFDPELSKKLLAEAGYAKGLTITGYMGNLAENVALAEAVKDMLANVGIDWKVDTLDTTAMSDRMNNAEYDLASGGWAYIWDPDMMATGLYHPDGGFNYGRSNNAEAIKLIELGKAETDLRKRQLIYWKLEKLLYDSYEDAWLWYPKNITAATDRVLGFNDKMNDIGLEGFYHSHPYWLKDGKP